MCECKTMYWVDIVHEKPTIHFYSIFQCFDSNQLQGKKKGSAVDFHLNDSKNIYKSFHLLGKLLEF